MGVAAFPSSGTAALIPIAFWKKVVRSLRVLVADTVNVADLRVDLFFPFSASNVYVLPTANSGVALAVVEATFVRRVAPVGTAPPPTVVSNCVV